MVGWSLLLPLLLLSFAHQVQLLSPTTPPTTTPPTTTTPLPTTTTTTTTTTTNTTTTDELKDAATVSTTPVPVTTFKPDPELSHTLEELIKESENDTNAFVEGTVNRKNHTLEDIFEDWPFKPDEIAESSVNKKNNTKKYNATKPSTENPKTNVENASSINASTTTNQPEVNVSSTTDSTTTSQPEVNVSSTQPQVTNATTEAAEVVVVPLTDKPTDTISSTTTSQPTTTKAIDIDLITSTETIPSSPDISPISNPVTTTVTIPVTTTEPKRESSSTTSPVKRPRPPAWVNKIARPIVFPLFLLISWLFLGFLLACHIAVPKLRENTGPPFMGYIVALMLKATVTFCNLVFKHLHPPGFCFYAAAISYLKSLALLFWVNIMVFDIWRKSRSLVKFKPSRPVEMWKYHLYGWGVPILLSLLSLLIELLVPDEASWIIKPGFDNGYKCWFEDSEAQLLYLNTPVGILHISNVILMVFTYRYVLRITDNAFIDDDQGAPGNTLPRDTAVPAAKRSDFISDFWFQFWILTYTVSQWVLWMIAQILEHFTGAWQLKVVPGFLIALQGVFLFIIFICNSGKRNILKQHFPDTFERITNCWSKVHKSQNKLDISKSNVTSNAATTDPQMVAGQTNPAYVEDENNAVSYIALANINQNQ